MIETVSGNIGLLEPLETLKEQFASSGVHQQKIKEFEEEFGGWRRCRGDGNCFYRACGFALIESLLRAKPEKLRKLLDVVRSASHKGETEAFLGFAESLCSLDTASALERWYRTIFVDVGLDAELTRAIRLVSAEFLTNHQEADFNGLP